MQAHNALYIVELCYMLIYLTVYGTILMCSLKICDKINPDWKINPIALLCLLFGMALIPSGLTKLSIFIDESIDINKYNYNQIALVNGFPDNYMDKNECVFIINRNATYSYYIEYPKNHDYFNTKIIIGKDILESTKDKIEYYK